MIRVDDGRVDWVLQVMAVFTGKPDHSKELPLVRTIIPLLFSERAGVIDDRHLYTTLDLGYRHSCSELGRICVHDHLEVGI